MVDSDERVRTLLAGAVATDAVASPVLEEVGRTLRIPFAGLPFRWLAADPPLLQAVWRGLAPGLSTFYVEREAERIRENAFFLDVHPELGAKHRGRLVRAGLEEATLAQLSRLHATMLYALPKLLVACAAAALTLRGEAVGTTPGAHSAADLAPLPRGVAPGAERPEPVALDALRPDARASLAAMKTLHGHLVTADYFRALARWPTYLAAAHDDLAPVAPSARFRSAAATLATRAEGAALRLPGRITIASAEGTARADAAAVFAYLHERFLPDLLLDAAFLRSLLEGARAARACTLSLAVPAPHPVPLY